MNKTQRGFGLLAAVLVVAALTAGSYAALKINEEIQEDKVTEETHTTVTATSSADASFDANAGIETDGAEGNIMLDASTTLQLGN